ncbi:MAG: flagellar motor switch protein FliN [Actinobacteria bacterium]|nr:flagellar motor switch protein FliN [Actinomycetota bacterium]
MQAQDQDEIYEELGPGGAALDGGADLGRLQNVPVELAVEIGRTRMTIGDALALGIGSVVTVGRLAGDPVDLLVNGRVIARGEVVAIEEELGLRITEIAAPVVEVPPRPPESDEASDPESGSGDVNAREEVVPG